MNEKQTGKKPIKKKQMKKFLVGGTSEYIIEADSFGVTINNALIFYKKKVGNSPEKALAAFNSSSWNTVKGVEDEIPS